MKFGFCGLVTGAQNHVSKSGTSAPTSNCRGDLTCPAMNSIRRSPMGRDTAFISYRDVKNNWLNIQKPNSIYFCWGKTGGHLFGMVIDEALLAETGKQVIGQRVRRKSPSPNNWK